MNTFSLLNEQGNPTEVLFGSVGPTDSVRRRQNVCLVVTPATWRNRVKEVVFKKGS